MHYFLPRGIRDSPFIHLLCCTRHMNLPPSKCRSGFDTILELCAYRWSTSDKYYLVGQQANTNKKILFIQIYTFLYMRFLYFSLWQGVVLDIFSHSFTFISFLTNMYPRRETWNIHKLRSHDKDIFKEVQYL